MNLNISATLNILKLIRDPSLCLPHSVIPTFNHIPIPLSKAFTSHNGEKNVDIRAVILDKDNCFAIPYENSVYKPYNDKFLALRAAYPGSRLLIVSNSAGTLSDPSNTEASLLEQNTGVKVLRHNTKKPGCRAEILSHFHAAPDLHLTSPDQIAVVGDRLFTDIMMANLMGARGIWVSEGVVQDMGVFTKVERYVYGSLMRRGYSPPDPRSGFEE